MTSWEGVQIARREWCLKCSHYHLPLFSPRCPACPCQKFVPVPEGVVALAKWKRDQEEGEDPPPSGGMKKVNYPPPTPPVDRRALFQALLEEEKKKGDG